MKDTCRSCGASIMWAVTSKGRKPIPLNPEPVEGGNIVLHRGLAIIEKNGERFGDGEPHYVSHFATCPNAAKHRNRKKEQ